MTRVLAVLAAVAVLGFVYAEWVARRDARRLEEAIAQAEALSAHPARGPVGPEDDPARMLVIGWRAERLRGDRE